MPLKRDEQRLRAWRRIPAPLRHFDISLFSHWCRLCFPRNAGRRTENFWSIVFTQSLTFSNILLKNTYYCFGLGVKIITTHAFILNLSFFYHSTCSSALFQLCLLQQRSYSVKNLAIDKFNSSRVLKLKVKKTKVLWCAPERDVCLKVIK